MFRFGLLFFALGLFFSFLFLGDGKMSDDCSLTFKNTEVARGTVTDVSRTNTNVNHNRIYAYRFQFKTNGKIYDGISYDVYRDEVKSVKIKYVQSAPEISKIAGMHATKTGLEGLLVPIFPIIGYHTNSGDFYLYYY